MVESVVGSLLVSVFGLAFVLVGVYTMHGGRAEWARGDRIAETETAAVRDLEPGTVAVEGTARPAEGAALVASAITGRDGVATTVEVEQWESSGRGGGNWETVHERQRAVPLTVDDGTGEVRVECPSAGEVRLDATETTVEAGEEPPAVVEQYVETEPAVDPAPRRELGPLRTGERRRYAEGVVEPGEDVYVLGRARADQSADWGDCPVVIDEATGRGDFLLSNTSREELVRTARRGGLVSLAFGGALVLAGLAALAVPWLGG